MAKRPALSRRKVLTAGLAGAAGLLVARVARAAPPQSRFAAIDWAAAETLLAAGIVPIAIGELSLYRQWLTEIPLPESAVDIGSRAEPNLELLASLKPERIFISNWQRSLAPLLRPIAPIETVAIVDVNRQPFRNAVDALLAVGRSGGPQAQARASAYLDGFEKSLKAQAASLAESLGGMRPRPIYVGVLHEDGTRIFAYGAGSWVHDILTRLGLRNALTRPTSLYGNALLSIAQLAESPDATLLYLDQGERTRRAERRLKTSTLWRHLPMVTDGRTVPIPPFYALGGVPSMQQCARAIAQSLLARGMAGRP